MDPTTHGLESKRKTVTELKKVIIPDWYLALIEELAEGVRVETIEPKELVKQVREQAHNEFRQQEREERKQN